MRAHRSAGSSKSDADGSNIDTESVPDGGGGGGADKDNDELGAETRRTIDDEAAEEAAEAEDTDRGADDLISCGRHVPGAGFLRRMYTSRRESDDPA